MEESFVHKNVHSAMVLGHARGVVMAVCAARGMSVAEYAPSSVKQTIAGSGRASKEAVADMVRRQLALKELPASADATDALSIALAHLVVSRDPLVAASAPHRGGKGGFDVEAYLERIGRKSRSP
jgi:crossover junction endodeoxyribonuclease RuvC